MIEKLFSLVLEASLTAGIFLLLVAALRGLFRRVPHRIFVLLWVIAGIRLLIPVSIESPVSARGLVQQWQTARVLEQMPEGDSLDDEKRLPEQTKPVYDERPSQGQTESVFGAVTELGRVETTAEKLPAGAAGPDSLSSMAEKHGSMLGVLWLCGAGVLLAYGVIRYLWLRFRLRDAVRLDGNVWQSDKISTPFLFGAIRPRIYVPFGLEEEMPYVLAHERAHLRNGDHLIKALWFAVLALYWFHPLVWLAYGLLGRDMELACDERVVLGLSDREKGRYAHALLEISMDKKPLSPGSLAFGEVGVKTRIVHVLSYKKPAFFGAVMCLLIGVIFAALLLTDPGSTSAQPDSGNEGMQEGQEKGDGEGFDDTGESDNCYVFYGAVFRVDENGSYNGVTGPYRYDITYEVYYKDGKYKANECCEPWERGREKTDYIYCGAVGSDPVQGQNAFANRESLLDSCGYYEELSHFENIDYRDMEIRRYREKQWYVDTEQVSADGGAKILRVEHWIDQETLTNVRSIVSAPGVYVEKWCTVVREIVSDQDMRIDHDRYMETSSGCYVKRESETPQEELRTLLRSIRDDVQPGTAGCSLKAGSVAIGLLKWAEISAMSVGEAKAVTEEFLATEADQNESFPESPAADRYRLFMESIEYVDDACVVLQSDGALNILDTIGMDLSDKVWGDEPLPLVEAVMEAAGLREAAE